MNTITIDLVKLVEQAAPQAIGSVNPLLLQQWLGHNTGATIPVTIDLVTLSVKNEAEMIDPPRPYLQPRVNDVTTFSDKSELRIHVLAPSRSQEDMATDAYYGLLVAISNI